MARLSEKQLDFLRDVEMSERPTDDFPQGVPFYIRYTYMEFRFNSEGERTRWLKNIESRGLIKLTGNGNHFARLTDAGRAALAAAQAPRGPS